MCRAAIISLKEDSNRIELECKTKTTLNAGLAQVKCTIALAVTKINYIVP